MINIENLDSDNLNNVYQEIAATVGIESMMEIYSMYKGQQVSFPTRLFSKEYITRKIVSEYDGNNIKKLAIKYEYSERWIREIIRRNR